jgi:hypothetical protein
MPCFDGYIEIDRSTTSRSGLYGSDLPGVEISMLHGLTKEDQDDYQEFWSMIVSRAWNNMVSDISIALQSKFLVDSKLLSRVTSSFKDNANQRSGLAGVKLHFELPRYARIHINTIEIFSEQSYSSPDANFWIYDTDENGEVLYEGGHELESGRNTIYVNQEFDVDDLFIAFDPEQISIRETENKYYNEGFYNNWGLVTCTFPCWPYSDRYTGTVTQHNGGGLNITYSVVCSVEKFVCQNINLFKMAFWYRIGVELMDEALLGNKLNRFATITSERAAERSGYFGTKYSNNLSESIKAHNIHEDPICFKCKTLTRSKTLLP